MREVLKRWSLVLVLAAVLFLALSLRITNPPALQEVRLRIFDAFQRLQPRSYEDVPVRIVDLDEESLAQHGPWPWPRTYLAMLVVKLKELGAAAVVFDIVFAEPDGTSIQRVLPLWPQTPGVEAVRAHTEGLADHDEIFGRMIGWAGNVVTGFALLGKANASRPASKAAFGIFGDDPRPYLFNFRGAVVNLKPLESAAAGNGSFSIPAEADGVIRRVPLLYRLEETIYPSLAAEALRVAAGASSYLVKSSGAEGETAFGESTGINHMKVGDFELPTDARGRLWLYDTGHIPERFVPAWRVMRGDADSEALAGAIVFIGTSAPGLKDMLATPLNAGATGVEVHAQLAEQMLLGEFLFRPDWTVGAEIVLLVALGVVLLLLLPRLSAVRCVLLGPMAGIGAVGLSWSAFAMQRLLLDPVVPCLMALLMGAAVFVVKVSLP